MNLSHDQLDELVLVLENEREFYEAYQRVKNATFGQRRNVISNYFFDRYELRSLRPDIEARDQLRRYFDDRYEFDQSETNKYAHIPYWRDPVEKKMLNVRLKPLVEMMTTWAGLQKWPFESRMTHLEHARKVAKHFGYLLDHGDDALVADAVSAAFAARIDPYADTRIDHTNEHSQRVEDALNLTKETTVSKPIEITTKTLVNGTDINGMTDAEIFNLISNQEAEIKALEAIQNKPKKLVAEIAKRQAGIVALVAHLDSKEA